MVRTPAEAIARARGDHENADIAATPGGIERQEAKGQADLVVHFGLLPQKLYVYGDCNGKDVLERMGFKIHGLAEDLFFKITPPEGWSIEPTEHNMWSRVLDEQKRRRIDVFYKAAFYDRRADAEILLRYGHRMEYMETDDPNVGKRRRVVFDNATGETLFACPARTGYDKDKLDEEVCEAYLTAKFPDWKDPVAYW